MKKNILSDMAKKIEPYQWTKNVAPDVLRFDTNTLPFPPPSVKTLIADLKSNCPINEYDDPSYSKLKNLIADYEGVDKDMLTITNSGDEALDVIGKAFLNDGDYFLVQPPTYEMFKLQCEINRGRAVEVPLLPNTFEIDVKTIIAILKKQPIKITFVCSPNNPTGTIAPLSIIKKIAKTSSGIVLVDEAYREFSGITSVPLLKKYSNIVILRSFSKFGAMAGARVGYLIANQKLSQVFDAIRFPLGVSYFSCRLAELLLTEDLGWIKKQTIQIIKEQKYLTNILKKLGLKVYPSRANFLLVKIGPNASIVSQKLKDKNILVRDRSKKKYLDGCVRITVRSPKENNILIKNLQKIL